MKSSRNLLPTLPNAILFPPFAACAALFFLLTALPHGALPSTTTVGSGSYTTTFPGTDIAGRNGFPAGTPQLSGEAQGRPVPTNDWWSALLNTNHADNLFNYPMAMRTLPAGLDVGRIIPADGVNGSSQPLSDVSPIIVGLTGLSANRATVDDYSDWTVTMAWNAAGRSLRATTGMGMPFIYFSKGDSDTASVTVNVGTVSIQEEVLLITNSQEGTNFAVYAPSGSAWEQSGNTYTSSLAGKNYWSIAQLPAGSPTQLANAWKAHAYVEPVDTAVSWHYDQATARLRTDFITSVTVHEGNGNTVIQGLLPHQWAHIAADGPAVTNVSIPSIRGELKLIDSNAFATERTFQGILPTLPAPGSRSPQFDPAKLNQKIRLMEDETMATWTDSYNEGQILNRMVQTARIAHETGQTSARDKLLATIRERLENWLTAESGEVAFLFYYNTTWSALLGYPAGHGQDTNLNDHHFHWGYFIHAAAFLEQFQPGWAGQWGDMVNLLVRDAASPDREDPLFPFLRSFSPFAGHAWANGFATFPFGNDQESSSESMQFNSALIHWGEITGNTAIRDLGIYLYTTEQSAIEEYWLDIYQRTFKPNYGFSLVSRIWGNGYDNQTFWTSDIAAAYGIELYPVHGGSLYLGQHTGYAERLWNEMTRNTGILDQAVNDNLWHDVYWQFLAFTDPSAAIALYDDNPDRNLKFGVSDAQTYYWLHAMDGMGRVDATVTADHPVAAVFDRNGRKTYVAHNYSTDPATVAFSDGTMLEVPPRSLATNHDLPLSGSLHTPFPTAPAGNTVSLSVSIEGEANRLQSVEFFNGTTSIGTVTEKPYVLQTDPLAARQHTFYARLHTADDFTLTAPVSVSVGDGFPFSGQPTPVPGSLEPGNYDRFAGGLGQGITYQDSSVGNNGDYRTDQYVDAFTDFQEGSVIGWIADGEWLEYTVLVETDGLYTMTFRYASGNDAGGGPFSLQVDGRAASPRISVPSTGDWSAFQTAVMEDIELPAGQHTLRLAFHGGEFNIGRMTFAYQAPLGYQPPVADAGPDTTLLNPASSVQLDGAGSRNPSGSSLTYQWEQISGPVKAVLSDPSAIAPMASGLLLDGLYRFALTVNNETHRDTDVVEFLRGDREARPPTVAILDPADQASVLAGQPLPITVSAQDPDGKIVRIELFNQEVHLATLTKPPFVFTWSPPEGEHTVTARATDSDALSTTSSGISLVANPAPPCTRESASGDFAYTFGEQDGQPTVTFTPSRQGVGASVVLLYYGVGGGPYPGYPVTPDVPFPLNAATGEQIGFYFTYSVPEGGERNTIAENTTYTIGTCSPVVQTDPDLAWNDFRKQHFTPAELDNPAMEDSVWGYSADPDGDGLSNLVEFVTGSDPLAVSPPPVRMVIDPLTHQWRVRWSSRQGLPDQYARLQWSTDARLWQEDQTTTQAVSLRNGVQELQTAFPNFGDNPPQRLFIRILTTPSKDRP